MAEDWLADVQRYVPNADEAAVKGIVRYCGIALQKLDSSLVSFSDSKETDRVRENFLKKKLGLTNPDSELDAAIADVGQIMKGDHRKKRPTVYYLLAEKFGLLGLFGGTATAVKATPAPAPAPAASSAPAATLGAVAGAAAAGVAGTAAAVENSVGGATASATDRIDRFADATDDAAGGGGIGRWWPWLLLALLAILLFFGLRSCMQQPVAVVNNTSDDIGAVALNDSAADLGDGNSADGNLSVAAPAVPAGAGVLAETVNGAPKLKVYFDTGKTDLTADFATKAAAVKDYVTAHAGTKLAVSGFNDPTGNAAANAKLSKNRAESVAAGLKALGIPADAISLEKPADTTITAASNAEARRVEVTVKQ